MNECILNEKNLITHEDYLAVSRRCHYNEFIAEFYERFADDERVPIKVSDDGEVVYGKDPKFLRIAKKVKACCKNWTFDFFRKNGYKNLVRTNRCEDRFCLNCQALIADQRLAQYSKVLDELTEDYDLYHVVLTVPNVDAHRLRDTVSLMFDRFAYLIRYFNGTKKARYVDFEKYGYAGAVRSLEITVSKRDGSYHPHFHCMFVLKKGLNLTPVFWNSFSEDRTGRTSTRLFTEFEVLLQRVWALLILKIPVTKTEIETMKNAVGYPNGFSVVADLSNGKYNEIFKYAIKGSFKEETLFKYETFRTLYDALFNRRVYQAYGCLSKYDFNEYDTSLGLNGVDDAYDLFLAQLRKSEVPKRIEELLDEILVATSKERCKYVSKATFTRHFKALRDEDRERFMYKLLSEMSEEEVQLSLNCGQTSDQKK